MKALQFFSIEMTVLGLFDNHRRPVSQAKHGGRHPAGRTAADNDHFANSLVHWTLVIDCECERVGAILSGRDTRGTMNKKALPGDLTGLLANAVSS